ncbi:MFS transporter [Pigmentiphaga soli]|uniref:MFS transporter n=1 Tax=Pigmentiphaga soli TaxID=1007095 RepID=A0ABP8GZM5_9BURK
MQSITMRKVLWRLMPLLIIIYLVAWLDRVNISFAALQMNKALGLSATAYGTGAGLFFLGYFLCEVPSNLMMVRFGARRWIARIMVTWGIIAGGSAFIQGEHSFYVMRVLLGLAEAGLFPGLVYYMMQWMPNEYRGRAVGLLMAASPFANVVGSPLSAALLGMDGIGGLGGWQWLLLLEAAPAIILAAVVLRWLPDNPGQAGWLAPAERDWLSTRLAQENAEREKQVKLSVGQVLLNPRVLLLAAVYYVIAAMVYTNGFWLPQIVKGFGLTNMQTGLLVAIPYLLGTIGCIIYGRWSDRDKGRDRSGYAIASLCLAFVGAAIFVLASSPEMKMLGIVLGILGQSTVQSVFWTLPASFLSGPAAAAGIAIINSLGVMSGLSTNWLMGAIKDATGSYTGGFIISAGSILVAIGIILALRRGSPAAPVAANRPA